VAWRGRGLRFGLLLLFFSSFVFVSHGDSLTPRRLKAKRGNARILTFDFAQARITAGEGC
jgi:hypothetical protein